MNLPLDASRQIKCLPGFEAFDVCKHMARVRLGGRQAQPRQPGRFAVLLALEKFIQVLPVDPCQGVGQSGVNAPVGAGDRLGADALHHADRWQQNVLAAQPIGQLACQHNTLVGLPGQIVQAMHGSPIMTQSRERLEAIG